MKNKIAMMFALAMVVSVAAVAQTAGGRTFDTMPVLDSRPGYLKLHAKALELAKRHVEKPNGWKPQMACFPGVRTIWQWDSCLMALYAGYTPGNLNGLGNLDNLYSMQSGDGYISMAYQYDTRKPTWPGRVNPPIFAWCEWLYARRTGDLSRLPRIYEPCARYFYWLKANRVRKNGLYWFEDTGSCMDNSPRSGYYAYDLKGSDVCFVDFCCEQVLAAKCLAKIASAIGRDEDVGKWLREAEDQTEKINTLMWCEKTGFYHDVFEGVSQNKLAVKTSAAFWALVSGVADGKKAARLADHLKNPVTFGSVNPVPSLAREDPNYDPDGGYWLGGVWPPVVYMVCCGLREQGRADLAREIAKRHLDCMLEVMESPKYKKTIWECYSPERAAPGTKYGGKLCRKDFVGWGGLGPIVMLVEDVIGLDIRAIDGRIDWTISEPGRQGLRDFPFNGGSVTLLADADIGAGNVKVDVTTERPFHLKVMTADGRVMLERDFAPGQCTATGSFKGN